MYYVRLNNTKLRVIMSVSTILASQLLIKNENDRRERLAQQSSHKKNNSLGDKSITREFNRRTKRRQPSPELEAFLREEREHFARAKLEIPARKQLVEEVSKKPGECDLEKAKQLLEQVTVNQYRLGDNFGIALFNKAVSSGHLEIVRAVIAKGADPNCYAIRDAVNVAQRKEHSDIKAFLIDTYPKIIEEHLPSLAKPQTNPQQRSPAP